MKIITNTKFYGKLCYVQVKDVLFLARYTGNKRLMQDYINTINNGKSDNEFIKVSGDSYIKAFELCDYIIDFSEYSRKDIGINYLSNLVKTKAYAMPKDEKDQEGLDHQIDGVRDMIAYKRGDIDFKIPLVSDGKFEKLSQDNKLLFSGTIIDGCYSLKRIDGKDISEVDYQEFLNNCLDNVYNTLYPGIAKEEIVCNSYTTGNILVINMNKPVIKKKTVVGKILAKIKKEN